MSEIITAPADVESLELMSFLDGPRPSTRLGRLRRFAVRTLAAMRADDFRVPVSHFVQEGGECFTTVFT